MWGYQVEDCEYTPKNTPSGGIMLAYNIRQYNNGNQQKRPRFRGLLSLQAAAVKVFGRTTQIRTGDLYHVKVAL
jgi:hypothetical protein